MGNLILGFVLGLGAAIIFHPLIDAGLNKLFKKNS